MPPGRRPGGLAAALEEERLELAAEHHRSTSAHRKSSAHAPQRRSILDTATTPSPGYAAPRHGSIAGIGVGVTPPAGRNPPESPPTPTSESKEMTETPSSSTSTTPSPTPTTTPATTPKTPYTNLKTAPPPLKRPDPPASKDKGRNGDKKSGSPEARRPSIRWDSGVDMPPSANGSRRFGPPQEKAPRVLPGKNAMAAVMSGFDLKVGLPSFSRGRDSSRGASKRGTSLDSHLPSQSRRAQSGSPARRLPSSSLRGSVPDPPKPPPIATNENKPEAADEKLLPSSASRRGSAETDAKASASGDERLYDSDNNASESSEEEEDSSSDEETSSLKDAEDVKRGRKKVADRDSSTEGSLAEDTKSGSDETDGEQMKSDGPELIHSSKTGPMPKTPEVQLQTNFDPPSVLNTPFGSDDEAELSDIKRAQKLSIQMSSVDNSVPNRSIRTIIRGDYTSMQLDAEGGRRRQRKYLVTTDLSEESVYALEWTIGTILRDGDTLFAVFAMHEETGTQIGDGAKATQDVAAVVGSQTAETVQKTQNDSNPNLSRTILGRLGSGTDSRPGSVDSRAMSKAEAERGHAVQLISQTCVRLLRKTLLQVRIAVEVIHCKSPKNMITEAIDGLEPTLVIVGARGRSALKGVLLGSFSNYLVTHSSVPVMVARKKLKKKAKNKTNVRLSNNLTAPKKLSSARVD
ncbi:hypothetical protein BJY04DRAFT_220474 [Aspergillus karnatakaensis]|uniref:universal stress protein family domain protein n=1 Tax=Aspergillus karnatakaensis TaxID=1810916 RepID=UPI003CCD5DF8